VGRDDRTEEEMSIMKDRREGKTRKKRIGKRRGDISICIRMCIIIVIRII
jgi:hypothetical protein